MTSITTFPFIHSMGNAEIEYLNSGKNVSLRVQTLRKTRGSRTQIHPWPMIALLTTVTYPLEPDAGVSLMRPVPTLYHFAQQYNAMIDLGNTSPSM